VFAGPKGEYARQEEQDRSSGGGTPPGEIQEGLLRERQSAVLRKEVASHPS